MVLSNSIRGIENLDNYIVFAISPITIEDVPINAPLLMDSML